MKRIFGSLLFISLLFFNSNACFSDYNQGGYCSEAEYYQLKAQYDAILQRMQATNPYTQLGQISPLDLSGYTDAMNRQQQVNAMMRANQIATGGQAQPVDFATERMQLALARQAEEAARKTGLTPEQYLQGQAMNYNTSAYFYQQQMQQYADLMTQCLKNMRRQQYSNY